MAVINQFSTPQAKDAYTNWQTHWNTLSGMTGSKWEPKEITFQGKHIDWAATQGSKDKKKQRFLTDDAWSNYLNLAGIDPHSETGKQPDPWQKSQSNTDPSQWNQKQVENWAETNYDLSAVDAARDKNYTAQEQLALLPENNNKDPWHTIDSHWSSMDARNPLPQGSARDFDRRDTSTWSDWMKSHPYSGFKNYWDYERAETAYTKKQSAASEMYFDQDAGEWYLKTPDKYHSYNPGGSNYDPRFSMSFEQAKADKGWTSFVPQDHRSWKRGDDPLTPIPDYLSEGGEDLAFLNWGKQEPPDPSKRLPHGPRTNILNYYNSGGSMGEIPEGWTEEDVREYIRNEQEGFQSRSALKGTEIADISGTPGTTSFDFSNEWENKFLNMYGQEFPLIAGIGLSDLGINIGSNPLAPTVQTLKRIPKEIGNWVEDKTKEGIGGGYDKYDFSSHIREALAEETYNRFGGPFGFKREVFDASSEGNAELYDIFSQFPGIQKKILEEIKNKRPVFIDETYKASKIGKLQQEGKYLQMLIEGYKVNNMTPQQRIKYFMKNVPQYNR